MLLCSNNIKHVLPLSFFCKESFIPGSFVTTTVILLGYINTEHIKIPSKATMTIYYAMRNGTKNIFLEMMAPFFWSHHIIPWTDCDCFLICMPTKRFIKYPFSLSKFTHFLARQWDGPFMNHKDLLWPEENINDNHAYNRLPREWRGRKI